MIEIDDRVIDEIDDAPAYPLAIDEANALSRCEAVIARGVQTFIEVGEALAEIRDGKLYRAGFDTFEHYCRSKWGIGDSRARQLIGAAVVAREIETVTNVTLPNEGQARAIAKAAPADRPKVLNRADELAGDGPRTAKHIQQAAAEVARPDLPIEFAIAQRRFDARGHVLSEAWDGQTQRFVVRKDGGTGVVMQWPDVVSKLASLEAEPRDAPDHGASEGAAAYQAKEQGDRGILATAEGLIAQGKHDMARALLASIQVSTYARDRLLDTIPAGRQITLALTAHDCAALLFEANAFERSGLTRDYPTFSKALILLVQAIKGAA